MSGRMRSAPLYLQSSVACRDASIDGLPGSTMVLSQCRACSSLSRAISARVR